VRTRTHKDLTETVRFLSFDTDVQSLSHTKKRRFSPRGVVLNAAICAALGVSAARDARAADRLWDGGGANDLWSTPANWDGDLTAPVANDTLTFDGQARLTPNNNLAADTLFTGFTFAGSAGNFVIGGNRITLGGDLADHSSNDQRINLALLLNANRTVTVDGGTLTLGGVISGTGFGITKSGSGQLTLAAANTYTGPTVIDGGTLAYTVDNTALSSLAFGTTPSASGASANTGTLDLTSANLTTGALTVQTNSATPNQITIGTGKTLTVNGAFTMGVGNVFSEANPGANTLLNVSGNSVVVNSGTNTLFVGIGRSNAASGTDPQATMDLSNLSNFTFTATTGVVDVGGGNLHSFLTLANTSNTITAAALNVGNSNVNAPASGNNNGGRSFLHLGNGNNVINTNTITLGDGKSGGILDFAAGAASGTLTLVGEAGGTSTVNIQLGSSSSATGAGDTSELNLAGHNVTVQAGNVVLGRLAGGTGGNSARGLATFDTGTFTIASLQLGVNSSGSAPNGSTGTFTLGGPTAGNAAATGTLNVTTQFLLANRTNTNASAGSSSGSFVINGGTANITTDILDGSTTTNSANPNQTTLTLDGGTLKMNGRNIGSYAAPITTVNLNSGTFTGAAVIAARTINLQNTVTVSGAPQYVLAPGGALNSNALVLTLPTGATIAGGGATEATVNGGVLVGAGATVAPGFGSNAGTLTFNGDLTLAANSMLAFKLGTTTDVGNGVNDLVNVLGSLAFNGTAVVSIIGTGGGPAAGTYRLLNYTSPGTAISGTNLVVIGQTRQNFTLDTSTAGQVNVTVGGGTGPLALVWRGNVSPKWNLATDANFINPSLQPDRFFAQDSVTFDDTATNPSPTVELVGALGPSAVTVNAARNYTFGGAGSISLGASLTKSGTGTLTLANTGVNDYTGGTVINAGVLQVGSGGAGAGNLPLTGAVTNNATLVFNRSDASTFNGVVSGAGEVKILAGTVTLGGASTYTGPTTVTNNAVVKIGTATGTIGGASALGAIPGGDVHVYNGSAIDLTPNGTQNTTNFGQKQFFIEGSGPNGQGVIVNSGVQQQLAFERVTLTGDATIGGTQRYDIRETNGVNISSLDLAGHTLTKIGANQFSLVATNVSESGNIVVNAGTFSVETTTVFGGTNTITFNDGTTAQFFSNTASPSTVTRPYVLNGAVRIGTASNNNTTVVDSNILLNGDVTVAALSNNATSLFTLNGQITETPGTPRSLTKTGNSVLTLANTANSYTGKTVISGGTVVANLLANGGLPSSIGAAPAAAGNLVVTGAMLSYAGQTPGTTDRQLTLGGNVILDAAGAGGAPMAFTSPAAIPITGAAPLNLTLGGFNADANLLAGALADGPGPTTIQKTGQSTWTLGGVNHISGTTSVSSGLLRLTGADSTMGGVSVGTSGTVEFAARHTVASLNVDDGAIAQVTAGAVRVGNDTTDTPLSLNGSGKLDLRGGAVLLDVTPGGATSALQTVRGQIITAYNGGNWGGTGGIGSSVAANDTGKAVGYALGNEVALDAGGSGKYLSQTIDASTVVARFTLAGDATLDGIVDFNDLVKLAQNYNTTVSSTTESWWTHGDFTYDGITDFNDLVKLAQNYNTALPAGALAIPGASAAFEADLARAFASVPEPGTLGTLGLVGAAVMGRRRRRRGA